jgi:GNAT superfamily N-acetyltransferase
MNSSAPVAVLPVEQDHLPEFFRLVDALADYEKLPRPNQTARERLARDLTGPRPRIQAYLAWKTTEPAPRAVGYLILLETYSSFLALPTLFIEDIFVAEEARGTGAGRALLGHAVTEAKQRGCGRVEFLVLDWNRLARDFYERAGATHLHDWVAYRIPAQDFDRVVSGLGIETAQG